MADGGHEVVLHPLHALLFAEIAQDDHVTRAAVAGYRRQRERHRQFVAVVEQGIEFEVMHRAGALWLWLFLAVLALSSIAMNLRLQVVVPLLSTVSTVTPSPFTRRGADPARTATAEAALPFAEIAPRAAVEAQARGWDFGPGLIYHYPAYGLYAVRYWPSATDRGSGFGRPILYFDDRYGRLFEADLPGTGSAADIYLDLQLPLHSGRVAGLPGRIAICVAGIGITVLTVTGVIIWWRKRPKRRP